MTPPLTPEHEYRATFNPFCSCGTCRNELARRLAALKAYQ